MGVVSFQLQHRLGRQRVKPQGAPRPKVAISPANGVLHRYPQPLGQVLQLLGRDGTVSGKTSSLFSHISHISHIYSNYILIIVYLVIVVTRAQIND